MLAAFLADPEKFVDYAGQATEFAVQEFAKAGIQLASAVTGGAARGLEKLYRQHPRRLWTRCSRASLSRHGPGRTGRLASLLVIVGLPIRWIFRPFAWMFRPLGFAIKRIVPKRPLADASQGKIADRSRSPPRQPMRTNWD